ncbi:unnamed protein product [Merluccius merluccius]
MPLLFCQATIATEDGHSDDEDETLQHWQTDYGNDIKDLKKRMKDEEKEIRRLRRLNLQLQERILGNGEMMGEFRGHLYPGPDRLGTQEAEQNMMR